MEAESRISWISILVIVAAVAAVAGVGGYFSSMNRDWYDHLQKPTWQPPNWAFPIAWNIIFFLSIVSLVIVWNSPPKTRLTYLVVAVAILNGLLNVLWSWLFFGNQLIILAVYDAALIFLSVILIMILAWPISKLASLLFLPYATWTLFATFLTWQIYLANPQ